MGSQTGIAWTDHTFNPWRGCTKVSPGCANCYAEKMSHRNPAVLGEWGPAGRRVMAAPSYWRLPVQWDAAAKRDGVRRRVFCASLADVFEARPELDAPRRSLVAAIAATPNLDWLLLTKRPENITRLMPEAGLTNVWLGVSVEDQATADARIPILLDTPAAIRFVSYEPTLGPVSFRWLPAWTRHDGSRTALRSDAVGEWRSGRTDELDGLRALDWIIFGGESGAKARPCDVAWARSVRDQCEAAGIAFFMKQRGSLWYDSDRNEGLRGSCAVSGLALADGAFRFVRQRDAAGADPAEWPEDLRVREFPRLRQEEGR